MTVPDLTIERLEDIFRPGDVVFYIQATTSRGCHWLINNHKHKVSDIPEHDGVFCWMDRARAQDIRSAATANGLVVDDKPEVPAP